MLGPIIVDGFPILLGHHAVDGFESGDGDGADLGFEGFGEGIELARLAPAVGAAGADAAAVGGIAMIEAGGIELGGDLLDSAVDDFGGGIAFVSAAPDDDGRMRAIAEDFVADVVEIHLQLQDVGAVAAIGLEEFIPDHDAVLVAEVVEIVAGALADPVADHVEIGLLMQADLGFEAFAGDALHGFVDSPVAALAHDGDAVDGDGEIFGAGEIVSDLSDAEGEIAGVGDLAVDVEGEVEFVEMGLAVAIGPPEFRVVDVELGDFGWREGDGFGFIWRKRN